jgi:peptide/nickel transport system permease protein
VSLVAFLVTNIIPSDPVVTLLGEKTAANPVAVAAYEKKWGFDKPLPVRYLVYLRNLSQGDLGESIETERPVLQDIAEFFPATVELAIAAVALAMLLGVPLGVLAALRRDSWIDHLARFISLFGSSIPVFWLALIALEIFFVRLHIAPAPGRLDVGMDAPDRITGLYTVDSLLTLRFDVFWNALKHLALPSLVLGASVIGLVARLVRGSVLDELNADYVRTARAKGLRERRIIWGHALRNALIPTVTALGIVFAQLMGGAVLTETTFAWPGLGRYAAHAAISLDFSAIMGVTLLVASLFVVINLLVDISYGLLDPRIRLT